MRIGEVADRAGVSTKALRFYEREGLLPPPRRTSSGYRDYEPDVVDRVRFVKDAQASGFTLAQVAEVLAIRDEGDAPCEHVVNLVERRLSEVEQRLRELRAVRTELRGIAARAEELDPSECAGFCGLIARADGVGSDA